MLFGLSTHNLSTADISMDDVKLKRAMTRQAVLFTWAPNADRGISLLCAPTPSYKGAGLMDMHKHTYIHTIHTHAYTCTHIHTNTRTHIHKYYTYMCTHEYIYTYAHTCTHADAHIHIYTHTCVYPLSDSVTEPQGRDTPRGKPPFDLGHRG